MITVDSVLKNYSKVGKTELSCNTNTYLDQYCMRSSLEEIMVTTIDNDALVGHFIRVDRVKRTMKSFLPR